MEVDCKDIRTGLFAGMDLPGHIEGFVVIKVACDPTQGCVDLLDVVVKYTARHRTGTGGGGDVTTDVESIDVEEVMPKFIRTR